MFSVSCINNSEGRLSSSMVPRKRKLNNSGILSNSYIPPLSAAQIERELQKLPPESLYSLTHVWLSIPATKPIPDADQKHQGFTKDSLSREYLKKLESLKKIKVKANLKKTLVNTILVEFYPRGLNTLQLAQIDVQLLVDKPSTNLWVSSTAKIVNSTTEIPEEEDETREKKLNQLSNYTFSLDSQLFLDKFISNLSNLFLTHVYISRHPYYPLILIRVQMYNYSYRRPTDSPSSGIISDLTNSSLDRIAKLKFEQDFQRIVSNKMDSKRNSLVKNGFQRQIQIQNKPQIIPHKPFYILLPISSPHVIHTPPVADSVEIKLILQTLETTLSHSYLQKDAQRDILRMNTSVLTNTKIRIFPDSDVTSPIRNLDTIFTLKGISRFGSSLGAWTPYADNMVDMGILSDELKHQVLHPEQFIDLNADEGFDVKESDRKRVAALKFKGCVSRFKSKELSAAKTRHNFEPDTEGELDSQNDDSNNNATTEDINDVYASIVPIHECNFEIEDTLSLFFRKRKNDSKAKKQTKGGSSAKDSPFRFKMNLFGSDVFGGLHELAANGYLNPYETPDWLTGESGSVGGLVKNGRFKRK